MGAFVSTDVTVTIVTKDMTKKRRINRVTMAFGDGALTYPALGIPFGALSRLGLYNELELAHIEQPHTNGYVYKIDKTNRKIRIYQSAGFTPPGTIVIDSHVHDMTFIGGITATEPVAIAGGDTLGKNAATNRTILGADVATKGGVKPVVATATVSGSSVAVGPLVEMATGAAPAAITLNMLVYGR